MQEVVEEEKERWLTMPPAPMSTCGKEEMNVTGQNLVSTQLILETCVSLSRH